VNYLAHAYLSFNHNEILIGNMISDFVKGRKRFDYAAGIQKGITLHRLIDEFTDNHAATKEGKAVFKPAVGLYAAAFMDVVYDHFLAADELIFSDTELSVFADDVYTTLVNYKKHLPEKFSLMLPYMQSQNWLYNYKEKWGLEKSFGGLVKRANYLETHEPAYYIFLNEYNFLQACYKNFITDVKTFAAHQFQLLITE
jgi:acyl carrier protein phosphodiesterase